MKFTYSWLLDHLDTTASAAEIAETLTRIGLEVESMTNPADALAGIRIADVKEVGKHPDADRLSLCRVDGGDGTIYQVVCGAPNVRAGMKAAFAVAGTVIPNSGQPLKKGVIRGVESQGMLCSAEELCLDWNCATGGILDLETRGAAGESFATAMGLDDPIFELSITPNRGDCFSVRGIARDLAAAGLGTLKPLPHFTLPKAIETPSIEKLAVTDSALIPAFLLHRITGLRNGPSPDWMQRRMRAVGLKVISGFVDVTNYICHTYGRPLHAFDAAKVSGGMTVHPLTNPVAFKALDGQDYTLPKGAIAISDQTGVISLAGIMGGISTACNESSTAVLLESAVFDAQAIARTGQQTKILSDARTRFERGVDPALAQYGLDYATHLLVTLFGTDQTKLYAPTKHTTPAPNQVAIEASLAALVQQKCGVAVSTDRCAQILIDLGCTTVVKGDSIRVTPPSWRADITIPEDLVEEVLRIHGYDHIPVTIEARETLQSAPLPEYTLRQVMAGRGACEHIGFAFADAADAQKFAPADQLVHLENPISQDLAVMRPSLLGGLLRAVAMNQARGVTMGALFEIGATYAPTVQTKVLTLVRWGTTTAEHWSGPVRPTDAFDVKADVLALIQALGLNPAALRLEASAGSAYHPGQGARLMLGNKEVARFGCLHPRLTAAMDVDGRVMAAEVFLDNFPPNGRKKGRGVFAPTSYQAVERDFGFVVKTAVPAQDLVDLIAKMDKALVETVDVFDVYQGKHLPADLKSIALRVRLQPKDRTLTDAEINAFMDQVISKASEKCGAILRRDYDNNNK